jgi:hypothetical protein
VSQSVSLHLVKYELVGRYQHFGITFCFRLQSWYLYRRENLRSYLYLCILLLWVYSEAPKQFLNDILPAKLRQLTIDRACTSHWATLVSDSSGSSCSWLCIEHTYFSDFRSSLCSSKPPPAGYSCFCPADLNPCAVKLLLLKCKIFNVPVECL